MNTIHINAKDNEFSDIVLMSGDPLRIKYIAKTFLKSSREINNVRGMLAFTGYYKNRRISVMAHGIGVPSCILYTIELITSFNVKIIYRIGSCGAINNTLKLGDLIIAIGASTDSKINKIKFNNNDFSAVANFELIKNITNIATNKNIHVTIGNIFTTDMFYHTDHDLINILKKYNILAIDMETAGLYSIAAEYNIKAVAICTVSDEIYSGNQISSKERELSFNEMIELALESTLLIE
uniref:Purine nucleoside phosphorylase DeoD-type n=1 Tax=Candidatus Aschnera chinzeii TaxID=1485666 RepID=A0AAT9G4X0_9ENTR|nr:MAG: purine-nucleoside phosphorylase [Candidatus Aschnera chinzeii]